MQNKLSTITLAVIASTLLLGSASASATNYKGDYKGEAMPAPAPCPQPLLLRDGFYLGAQVGYDAYRVRATSNTNTAFTGVAGVAGANYSANPVVASNGFAGGIFGGYGMYWNNWYYLGAEVFFNGSAASQAQNISTTVNGVAVANTRSVYEKVSTGASWGISVLPGLKVNDSTLTYIRLGYNQAKLKGQSTYTTSSTAPGSVGISNYASKNTWQGGFNYGLGIETAVYPMVSVRSEYSHTGYNSFSDNNGTRYSASDNQMMVSLIYHFA